MQTEQGFADIPPGTGETTYEGSHSACRWLVKIRDALAETLQNTASALADKADSLEEDSSWAHYGRQASECLERSAKVVREYDPAETDAKLRNCVERNPMGSLLAAGAVGLLAGYFLKRR